jgi:hypothetical protein
MRALIVRMWAVWSDRKRIRPSICSTVWQRPYLCTFPNFWLSRPAGLLRQSHYVADDAPPSSAWALPRSRLKNFLSPFVTGSALSSALFR